jgi:hypothetical protein
MVEKHQGWEERVHTFDQVWERLNDADPQRITTSAGTTFVAKAAIATRGKRKGERVIRYLQNGQEYGRCYDCCWHHYYNCNRTRIGMYSRALDREGKMKKVGNSDEYWRTYSVLLSHWRVQNTILQACRSAFFVIGSLSLGLATDLVLSGKASEVALVLGLAMIPWTVLWNRTCEDRGHNDSYLRKRILQLEADQIPQRRVFTEFRDWQSKPVETKYHELSKDTWGAGMLKSRTRKILDFWAPCAYAAAGLTLAVISAYRLGSD